MKTKKITKKLTFSKSTIADLNSNGLNAVRGGATIYYTCKATCPQTCKITCMHAPGTACLEPPY